MSRWNRYGKNKHGPLSYLLNINDLLKNIDRSLVNIDKDVAKVYEFKSKDLEDQCLTVDPDHISNKLVEKKLTCNIQFLPNQGSNFLSSPRITQMSVGTPFSHDLK